ncbi:membrane protein [Arthrobacter phage Mufasa8]|uniref:Membrane protein n=1 Tax=Arthrobacter phage Mufasa8 TaxID=2656526 RepID=A0A649VMR5_9CAUD|nr:holin [Arthrobacter phage Mufasa8]QGJ93474.1 membrane protein [Arthrobacter phage Mufasa8]
MILFHFTGWALLALAVQFLLPVLIDLVTTEVTRNGVKTLLLAILTLATTLATGVLNAHDTGAPYDLAQALLTGLGGFILSIAAYYKVWKKSGVSAAAQNTLVTAPLQDPTPPQDPAPTGVANVVQLYPPRAAA